MGGGLCGHRLVHARMRFEISSELHAALLAEAAKSPDHEVCGLLLGQGSRVSDIVLADNLAENPARQFEVDPIVLINAHRRQRAGGPAILGCYHSHPNGRVGPSPQDAEMADQIGWLWIIIAAGALRGWVVEARGAFKEVSLHIV